MSGVGATGAPGAARWSGTGDWEQRRASLLCLARELRWSAVLNGVEEGLDVDRFGQVRGGAGGEWSSPGSVDRG